MLKWVRIRKFAAESGYTENAIRGKIRDGVWRKGVVWKHAPDGCVLINTEGYEQWVEQRALEPSVGQVLKSPSPIAANDAGSVSSSSPLPLI